MKPLCRYLLAIGMVMTISACKTTPEASPVVDPQLEATCADWSLIYAEMVVEAAGGLRKNIADRAKREASAAELTHGPDQPPTEEQHALIVARGTVFCRQFLPVIDRPEHPDHAVCVLSAMEAARAATVDDFLSGYDGMVYLEAMGATFEGFSSQALFEESLKSNYGRIYGLCTPSA